MYYSNIHRPFFATGETIAASRILVWSHATILTRLSLPQLGLKDGGAFRRVIKYCQGLLGVCEWVEHCTSMYFYAGSVQHLRSAEPVLYLSWLFDRVFDH
ncbi:hypothetical protein YALI1_D07261g [Yarrowia lipolytica]|uniref:Uncharacterized protein n=1 Tax=Yarrowia lipolytica TaxID=4952 RepID=A0A1D8NDC0_YARLL|nr:hypothetical protein YALI1_D07261g [Yarrowia lipolytica]